MLNPSSPSSIELTASHPIESVADLLAAARQLGLRLTTDRDDFDRSGLDFLVVHARDEEGTPWIVRTPRRPDVIEPARVEARVLGLIRPRLPVAVPDWRVFSRDVIAYPRLAGTPAVTVHEAHGPSWNIIDPKALPDAFLDTMAGALAALQTIAPEEAKSAGVPIKTIPEVRRSLSLAMEATREALSPSEAVWRRWTAWLEDSATWPEHVALVHGDLHPGHMLLNEGGQLVGILDWTEAQLTDPSVDLAMFFGCFGRPALEALVARFERAGGRVWPGLVDHAVERWAIFPVLAAEWALRAGNQAILEHAKSYLAPPIAEPPQERPASQSTSPDDPI
jgi:aminoglycoside phosphotransferase (APT) family kinase protein